MCRFRKGQKVRIKEWDEMAEQYGFDDNGNIKTKLIFWKSMKYLCGRQDVVENASCDTAIQLCNTDVYAFSDDMLEVYPANPRSLL